MTDHKHIPVTRVQTGVRLEKRILKVLKGVAEYHDRSLGDLLEGILLHVFEGKAPFGPESLRKIADLKKVYELDFDASASHRLVEQPTDLPTPELTPGLAPNLPPDLPTTLPLRVSRRRDVA